MGDWYSANGFSSRSSGGYATSSSSGKSSSGTSSSKGSSGGSSSSGSSSGNINTSGLSGYAAAWSSAYNKSGGNTQAGNQAANQATYGNASGPVGASQVSQALKGTSFSSGTKVTDAAGNSYTISSYNGGTPTLTNSDRENLIKEYLDTNKQVNNSVALPNMETRIINGSSYIVPVGTRNDWQPGQPYQINNVETPTSPYAVSAAGQATSNQTTNTNLNLAPKQQEEQNKNKEQQQETVVATGSFGTITLGSDGKFYWSDPNVEGSKYGFESLEDAYNTIPRILEMTQYNYTNPYTNTSSLTETTTTNTTNVPVTTTPTVETTTEEEATNTADNTVPYSAAGFLEQANKAPDYILPSAEKLLNTFKEIYGTDLSQDMQEYLQSPEFQGVLQSGRVPWHMAADPITRLALMRLGLLQPATDQSRMEALREALAKANSKEQS